MSEIPAKRAKTAGEQECRACLTKLYDESCFVDIFRAWDPAWSGMGLSIAEDLAKLTNIEINVSDPLSKNICKECCSRLQDAIRFTTYVQTNDMVLRERFKDSVDENPLWPKPIQVDALNEMTVEVKQEVLTEDEYEFNELTNEQYSELGEPSLDIKIEPEEIMPSASSHVIEINGPYSLQPDLLESKENGVAESPEESSLEELKEEPMTEDEAEPASDMPKDCMLCFKTFHTVKGLKAHVIAVHSYDTVNSPRVDRANVCTTCNRSFATRTDLFVHETCHSQFACYVCDKKFDTFQQLTKHRSKQCTKTSVLPRLKTLDDVRRPIYIIPDKKSPSSPSEIKKIPERKPSSQIKDTIKTNQASVDTDQVVEKPKHKKRNEEDELKKSSSEQAAIMNEVEQLLEEIHRETTIPEKSNIGKTNSSIKELSVDNESKKSPQSSDSVTMTYLIDVKLSPRVANGSEKGGTKVHKEFIDVNLSVDSKDIKQEQKSDASHVKDETAQPNSNTDKLDVDTTKLIISEDINKIKKELTVSLKMEDVILENETDNNADEVSNIKKENVQEVTTVPVVSTIASEDSLESKEIEDIQPQSIESCGNDGAETNSVRIDETDIEESFEHKLEPLKDIKAIFSEGMGKQFKIHSVVEAMDIDDLDNETKYITENDK